MIETGIINLIRRCGFYDHVVAKLTILLERGKERLVYRCMRQQCRAKNSFLPGIKLSFEFFLFVVFLVLCNSNYRLIKCLTCVSNDTILKIKLKLREYIRKKLETDCKIGGSGVQVDETVLCRRGTIRVPSRADDGIKDTVWILGLIEAVDRKKFCIVQVPDRKINTLTKIIEDIVLPGSVLISDGHPSYPGVAANLKLKHIIVNHSIGFTNEEGFHTNNIENFGSGMKSEMTKQHGVKRVNIESWLEEFTFRKNFLNNVFKNEEMDKAKWEDKTG
ncbi:DDE-TNP-IS1595 domain-containing protein [Vairimorpha necatrix]|uniref:DDE-TNP-IS1595 domain-containing protein n=1 Tax=Vairimorpha necatrix TaxID=6039 RepID=A0AAX4JET9_9MICR